MKIFDHEQGSPEWFRARLGCVTASNVATVITGKTGAQTYMRELAAQILTSNLKDEVVGVRHLDWGKEVEAEARQVYVERNPNSVVTQVGFIKLDKWIGASPDSLVDEDGTLEIKCPTTKNHIDYVLDGGVPKDYVPQIQMQLWVSGRQWCDFVSYDPRMPVKEFFCVRTPRDDKYILEVMAPAVRKFVSDLSAMVDKIAPGFMEMVEDAA